MEGVYPDYYVVLNCHSKMWVQYVKKIWWWQSWNFSIITLVFSVTWSFRNHLNMLIWCAGNISYYKCCYMPA